MKSSGAQTIAAHLRTGAVGIIDVETYISSGAFFQNEELIKSNATLAIAEELDTCPCEGRRPCLGIRKSMI
jgi:hypothetical protein